jgi:hypothetical protein
MMANLTTGKPIQTPTCVVYLIDNILAPPSRRATIVEYQRKAAADKAANAAADGAATSSPAADGSVTLPAASASPAPTTTRSGAAAVAPATAGVLSLLAAGAGWGMLML